MKELQHIKDCYVVERNCPLNPDSLKEIRDILDGVKSGRLPHDQTDYHTITDCGTAHCIAGWKAHNDAVKAGYVPVYELRKISLFNESLTISKVLTDFLVESIHNTDPWIYAKIEWELTVDESFYLFDSESTLDAQFELLEVLEAGYTVEDND